MPFDDYVKENTSHKCKCETKCLCKHKKEKSLSHAQVFIEDKKQKPNKKDSKKIKEERKHP